MKKHTPALSRFDPLLVLLAIATGALLVAVALGSAQLVAHLRAGRPLFSSSQSGGISLFSQIWSIVSMFLFVAVGWGFWAIFRRRQFDELRLRRSERKYRDIINHAGEAIFLLDGAGRVLEWNKAAESLFAAPRRNVLGKPFRDIHICYGVEIEKAMGDSVRLSRSIHFEFPLRRRGRQELGQLAMTVSHIAAGPGDRGGEGAQAFVVIARDITSEKRLEARMSETEKLAGIGQFAAGIAHQLNTPLGSILLSAQMLEESVASEDDVEDVQRIIRQTEQCRSIIKGLLNFARPSGGERGRLDLAEVVRDTVFLMEKPIRLQNVEVTIDDRDPGTITGNRNELEQVVFNLIANSLDAMPAGGEIAIRIERGDPGEVEMVFADDGEGVPPEYRDEIFLPFFTTKAYGKGTGLGLSIVARIIHEHGGRIELAQSEGARFHMAFPGHRPGAERVSASLIESEEDAPAREDDRAG
ncbi:PAS domain S-box protein [bacterium]|nr:PAS domain S-box protein [bacterium]MBU1676339.1 PAS domain S-box protein [bacterium]